MVTRIPAERTNFCVRSSPSQAREILREGEIRQTKEGGWVAGRPAGRLAREVERREREFARSRPVRNGAKTPTSAVSDLKYCLWRPYRFAKTAAKDPPQGHFHVKWGCLRTHTVWPV